MARMINFMSFAVYHNLKCEYTEWEIRKKNEEEKDFSCEQIGMKIQMLLL